MGTREHEEGDKPGPYEPDLLARPREKVESIQARLEARYGVAQWSPRRQSR